MSLGERSGSGSGRSRLSVLAGGAATTITPRPSPPQLCPKRPLPLLAAAAALLLRCEALSLGSSVGASASHQTRGSVPSSSLRRLPSSTTTCSSSSPLAWVVAARGSSSSFSSFPSFPRPAAAASAGARPVVAAVRMMSSSSTSSAAAAAAEVPPDVAAALDALYAREGGGGSGGSGSLPQRLKVCVVATGSGGRIAAWMLGRPGASAVLAELAAPYSRGALLKYLDGRPLPGGQYCAAPTARALAEAAYHRAIALSLQGIEDESDETATDLLAGTRFLGVACTAAVVSGAPKKGEHRAHICAYGRGDDGRPEVQSYLLNLTKGARTRVEEDYAVSKATIAALLHASHTHTPSSSSSSSSWFDHLSLGTGQGGAGASDAVASIPPPPSPLPPAASAAGSSSSPSSSSGGAAGGGAAAAGGAAAGAAASTSSSSSSGAAAAAAAAPGRGGGGTSSSSSSSSSGGVGCVDDGWDALDSLTHKAADRVLLVPCAAAPSGLRAYPSNGPILGIDDSRPYIVYPGSFNPLHEGHLALADAARALVRSLHPPPPSPSSSPSPARGSNILVAYEISTWNADKGFVDRAVLASRLEQFSAKAHAQPVALTATPLFVEKARLFPGAYFLIGADTAQRILDTKYYGHDREAMLLALAEIMHRGCRFVVGGRAAADGTFLTLESVLAAVPGHVPAQVRAMFHGLSETQFRVDLSSTEIRARLAAAAPAEKGEAKSQGPPSSSSSSSS